MQPTGKEIRIVKLAPFTIKDDGKVKMGFATPAFPPIQAAPGNVIDNGKVRTGFATPAFPPLRAR